MRRDTNLLVLISIESLGFVGLQVGTSLIHPWFESRVRCWPTASLHGIVCMQRIMRLLGQLAWRLPIGTADRGAAKKSAASLIARRNKERMVISKKMSGSPPIGFHQCFRIVADFLQFLPHHFR